jgi:hypothetical protein
LVSESDDFRKGALECLRLAAECMQLANSTDNPDLKAHFIGVAKIWTNLAESRQAIGLQTDESD